MAVPVLKSSAFAEFPYGVLYESVAGSNSLICMVGGTLMPTFGLLHPTALGSVDRSAPVVDHHHGKLQTDHDVVQLPRFRCKENDC